MMNNEFANHAVSALLMLLMMQDIFFIDKIIMLYKCKRGPFSNHSLADNIIELYCQLTLHQQCLTRQVDQ